MENERKYSLALVGKDGTTVLVSLPLSPKYKDLNLPINDSKFHTLKELCFFTLSFGNSLALKYHLTQIESCIDKSLIRSTLLQFATYDSKAVILDNNGDIVFDSLLFSNEGLFSREKTQNKFDYKNPFSFFEVMIFAKFASHDYDYLHNIGNCIYRILEQQSQYNSTPISYERLDAIKQFLSYLELFRTGINNEIQAAIIPEVLRLLLKKIFSTNIVTHENTYISLDNLDWEVILAIANYDGFVSRIRANNEQEDCGKIWRETYGNRRRPKRNTGNKNYH